MIIKMMCFGGYFEKHTLPELRASFSAHKKVMYIGDGKSAFYINYC